MWFHVVGTGAKWCHPYIAFKKGEDVFVAELWQLPISWAPLSKNPPSEVFALYDCGGRLWLKDGSLFISADHMKNNRELLHASSYWLIDKFKALVTRKPTLVGIESDGFFKTKGFAPPSCAITYKEEMGKDAILSFCKARNWMVHPSDIYVNEKVTSHELEEISVRLRHEIKSRTPSGVYNCTRCSPCWLDGELLKCSECERFSCCLKCHQVLKLLIPENEVVCVQCVFEEQGKTSLEIQKGRPDVRTLS